MNAQFAIRLATVVVILMTVVSMVPRSKHIVNIAPKMIMAMSTITTINFYPYNEKLTGGLLPPNP
jgi:hypothetical protein